MENENVENVNEEVLIEAKDDNNGIKISDDVVAVIAGVAVSEVPGVSGMAGGFAGGISEVLSGKKNMSKGIKVEVGEKEIQNRVKKAVETMTGLTVLEVNVHVQGVSTEKTTGEEKEVQE